MFGKALANGFSVSALAGKREFMRLGGLHHTDKPRVFLLSTTSRRKKTHASVPPLPRCIYEREPVIERLECRDVAWRKDSLRCIATRPW